MSSRVFRGMAILILALQLAGPGVGQTMAKAVSVRDQLLGQLARTPGTQVAYHDKTGQVRFIGTAAGHPVARPYGVTAAASPVAAARAFMGQYGPLFGITNQSRDLAVTRQDQSVAGQPLVHFQQQYQGVPVLGGEINMNLDRYGNMLDATGETSPNLSLSVTPRVSASAARATALRTVAADNKMSASKLSTSTPRLWIYDYRLLGGPGSGSPRLVWRMDVVGGNLRQINFLVLVDAQTGKVALHFNQDDTAKQRYICDANNSQSKVPCTSPYARTEGGPVSSVQDVNDAYNNSGAVYDFYYNNFRRNSIDNAGMPLLQTVRYCQGGCPFYNAFWNGSQMVYGPNFASADDVVGHEMTHGITDRTSHLFYWFQSGAINESLSDTMGELIDLTDGIGNDSAAVRWQLGEDLPHESFSCFSNDGAVRYMKDPTVCGDPDKMTSPNYTNSLDTSGFAPVITDNGGVHRNSGVNNKAAYLITDGGSFNGYTITGIGTTKAAQIYYEVDTNLLTSGSDYEDLYNDLYQACQNLVGIKGITATNCAQVRKATQATEMNKQPAPAGTFPNVAEAPMCSSGQIPTDLFYDNMENRASGKWVKQTMVGSNQWGSVRDYATSGELALYTTDQPAQSDTAMAMANGITVPTGKTVYLRFSHAFDFEYGYDINNFQSFNADGGVVEYSANGGPWTDAGSLFTDEGYDGSISKSYDNPLAGRNGFVSAIGGYVSSRMNLGSLAGQSVKFRFRVGTDTGNSTDYAPGLGWFGWLIDDVRIYTCASGSRPAPTTTNLVRDPGFEWDDNDDGYADGWTINSGALRMPLTTAQDGKYVAMFHGLDNGPITLAQTIGGIHAGQSYTFASRVMAPATSRAIAFTAKLIWRSSSNGVIRTDTVKTLTDDTAGAWTSVGGVKTAPTGAANVVIQYQQTGLANDTSSGANVNPLLYVDKVSFK